MNHSMENPLELIFSSSSALTKLPSGSNAVHEDVRFTPMTWRWKTGYDIPERQTE